MLRYPPSRVILDMTAVNAALVGKSKYKPSTSSQSSSSCVLHSYFEKDSSPSIHNSSKKLRINSQPNSADSNVANMAADFNTMLQLDEIGQENDDSIALLYLLQQDPTIAASLAHIRDDQVVDEVMSDTPPRDSHIRRLLYEGFNH